MQQISFFGKLLFAWAILTLLLVAAYGFLPPKTWYWVPADNLQLYIYADDMFGGASYAERASPDGIHMRCNTKKGRADLEPFCGFHIYMDGSAHPPAVDMSSYTKMHVDVDYTGGNEKLRFYMREFEIGFSDLDDAIESAKYMSVYIPAESTSEPLVIDLNEYTVADWWVNNYNVPRSHARFSLDNVVAFGIDVAFPTALGPHELKLNSVTFVGDWISAEDWYLGILFSWVAVILGGGALRLYQFGRLNRTLSHEKNQYQELFQIDHLTGLMNRHGLDEYFRQKLDERAGDQLIGVMFIDIDHFKPINDTYGHNAGDEVLKRVARCIGEHSRQSDKAARWGGEEFLMLLPGSGVQEAVSVAERLRQSVELLVHPELPSIGVTVSIGVSELAPGEFFERAVERADAALYKAKQTGRNKVMQFTV